MGCKNSKPSTGCDELPPSPSPSPSPSSSPSPSPVIPSPAPKESIPSFKTNDSNRTEMISSFGSRLTSTTSPSSLPLSTVRLAEKVITMDIIEERRRTSDVSNTKTPDGRPEITHIKIEHTSRVRKKRLECPTVFNHDLNTAPFSPSKWRKRQHPQCTVFTNAPHGKKYLASNGKYSSCARCKNEHIEHVQVTLISKPQTVHKIVRAYRCHMCKKITEDLMIPYNSRAEPSCHKGKICCTRCFRKMLLAKR